MGLIIRISLRNLFRQKRRNILLGIAIAIGIMLMVVATSFSKGISDIMFNDIVSYVAGHISIDFHEKSGLQTQIYRDKDRMEKIIKATLPEIEEYDESIGQMVRAIGNGKSGNLMVVGMNRSVKISPEKMKEYEASFKIVEGNWDDLDRKDIPNPVVIPTEAAEELNLKVGDTMKIRLQNIFGQWQAETLTVVGVVKTSNMFMSVVSFTELQNIKKILGYKPHETGAIRITIKNPKVNAKIFADKLHEVLKPEIAALYGNAKKTTGAAIKKALVIGYKSDEETIKNIKEKIKVIEGDIEEAFGKEGVLLPTKLASELGIKANDEMTLTYKNKFEGKETTLLYKVKALYDNTGISSDNTIIVNEALLYKYYFENLPFEISTIKEAVLPSKESVLSGKLATEWILLDRSQTTEELTKKMKDISKKKWKGTTLDVMSMYESASMVLQMEGVLNLITFSAVLILFFIILVGVVNTLRMTIRERTREIGTMRAIGMRKADVRNSFITETFFLTLISSIVGVIAAFIVMFLLSQIKFETAGNSLAIILKNGKLHFLPTMDAILFNVGLIHVIALITAFFPARKAANMPPTDALRHYE